MALGLQSPALAQTIPVRSGEHADFTRLAMVISPPTTWTLTEEGESYRLELARDTLRLDITEVFRFIPRNRLADLQAAPDAPVLTLRLACDCALRVFEDRPGILVIDIRDPSGDPPPPATASGEGMPGADLVTLGLARDLLAPRLTASVATAATTATGVSAAPVPAPTARPDPAAEDQVERLATAVARAASQGLVTPSRARIGAPPPDDTPRDGEAADDRTATTPEGTRAAPPDQTGPRPLLPGIRTGTALDIGLGLGLQGDPRSEGQRCLPDRALDLPAWGSDRPMSEALGAALAATTGEFDRVDPAAVRTLVRLYLHLGFGAEARATLRAFDIAPHPEDAVLMSLATIIDQGFESAPSRIWQMTDCPGPAALWAVLARPDLPNDVAMDEPALLQAFAALPGHLRRHLGPRLAERLLGFGHQTLATAVIEAMRHTAADNTAALELAMARIALSRGEASATQRLADLATGHGDSALGARLLLAESLLDRGAAPDPGLLSYLETEAFARRGTDEAGRLVRVVVLGNAAVGDIPAALAAMSRAGAATEGARAGAPPLWHELLARVARDTPATEFLRVLLTIDQWRGGNAQPALRFQLADRLMELGLARLASEALLPDPTLPEERLRLARALFDLDYPAEAMRRLAGLDSAEAARLRAAALTALGDVGGALGAHERAGDQDAIARLVWRAGLWDRVQELGAPEERALLAIPGAPSDEAAPDGAGAEPALPESPTLAEARSAIEASRDLRSSIDSLLNLHRIP